MLSDIHEGGANIGEIFAAECLIPNKYTDI